MGIDRALICPHCGSKFTEKEMIISLVKDENLGLTELARLLKLSKTTAWRKMRAAGFQFYGVWREI